MQPLTLDSGRSHSHLQPLLSTTTGVPASSHPNLSQGLLAELVVPCPRAMTFLKSCKDRRVNPKC